MKLNLSGFSTSTQISQVFQSDYTKALENEALIPALIHKWADRAYKMPDGTVVLPQRMSSGVVVDADVAEQPPKHVVERAKALNLPVVTEPANEFVDVFEAVIGRRQCLACDARSLWAFLGVKRDFSTWLKDRMNEYGFEEGKHYEEFSPKLAKTSETLTGSRSEFSPILGKTSSGRPRKGYTLTLDTAKHLAMVESSPQGRKIRMYFLNCERALFDKQVATGTPTFPRVRNPQGTVNLTLTTTKGSLQFQGDTSDPMLKRILDLITV